MHTDSRDTSKYIQVKISKLILHCKKYKADETTPHLSSLNNHTQSPHISTEMSPDFYRKSLNRQFQR